MDNVDVKDMHLAILDIAKYFHKVCVTHNIPYYMLGGTMLGAIRHKGFIPWDDDMDFGIPRCQVQKFISACMSDIPSYYKLVCSSEHEYQISYDTMKLIDTRYSIKEMGRDAMSVDMGLFIDIFPLDESNGSWSVFSRNNIIKTLLRWNSFKYIQSQIGTSLPIRIIAFFVKFLPKDALKKIVYCLLIDNGTHYSNYGGFWGARETVSKDIFNIPTLYQFEDTCFYGVKDYEAYLTKLYGNYLQLPPKEKRHLHIYQCKKQLNNYYEEDNYLWDI